MRRTGFEYDLESVIEAALTVSADFLVHAWAMKRVVITW